MAGRALLAGYPRYIQWANLQNVMYKYDIMYANFTQPITAYSWYSQKHEPGYGLTLSKIQVMIKIRKWSEAETCSLRWCNAKLATIKKRQVIMALTCSFNLWNFGIVIAVTLKWAWWRLKSPASRLFTQPFTRAQIKGNIKAPRHWPLCGEITGPRGIPRTNGQ